MTELICVGGLGAFLLFGCVLMVIMWEMWK